MSRARDKERVVLFLQCSWNKRKSYRSREREQAKEASKDVSSADFAVPAIDQTVIRLERVFIGGNNGAAGKIQIALAAALGGRGGRYLPCAI